MEEIERLNRSHNRHVHLLQLLNDSVSSTAEQRHLRCLFGAKPPSESWLAPLIQFTAFKILEQLLRPLHDRWRKPGKTGHVDAVAVAGRPFYQAAQKDDFPLPFLDGKVKIFDALLSETEVSQFVIMSGKKRPRAMLGVM